MSAIKFSQAISPVNFQLKTNVSEPISVSIIRVDPDVGVLPKDDAADRQRKFYRIQSL